MPPKKKEKKKQPTAEDRTEGHQYEMEYRIRTETDNAFCEVHVQLEKWIKRDGNKNDKGIQAAFWGWEERVHRGTERISDRDGEGRDGE